ncbi:hypothetical protein BJ165DRAFT_1487897 [Panaeolus papilionaceus]|nr:hypothetical protein BJ165DRAFT_1487897 [Panaeolus papilionaceus]
MAIKSASSFVVAAVLSYVVITNAAVVTVNWGTTIVSAIGPAESGLTKYEIKFIQSRAVAYGPETTQTFISEPVTAICTILREYGDPYHTTFAGGSFDVIGSNFDCTVDDEKKMGVCKGANLYADVAEVVSGTQTVLSTRTETMSTTFTGTVYPMATLGTPSGANKRSVPAASFIITMAAVVCGVCIVI